MNVRNLLLAATALVLPAAAAMAQPVNGLYVAGGAGYSWTQNIDVQSASVTLESGIRSTNNTGATLNGNGGFIGLGSVGWGFGDVFGTGGGVRAEVEGSYRGNSYKVNAFGGSSAGISASTYGVMVNALYDFNLGPVNPYIGAGLGYQWTSLGSTRLGTVDIFNRANTLDLSGSTQGSFAVQAILGASIPVGVPGLSLTAEYRFLAAVENETFSGTMSRYQTHPAQATIGDQLNHSFLLGLRYAFNAAPPPPPPAPAPVYAPAPAPARTYLVFFDWDRADLTGRARQIIAEAAQASTHVQLTQIEVSGFADRTGTAQYNLGLSRRRADNVAAELVRLGVPKNVIAIQAFGDTHLLVPTGPGVREPQNRRVEIVLK